MTDSQHVSSDVLLDIAFRARLNIDKKDLETYRQAFQKTIELLSSVSSVKVCDFKDYSVPPIACHDLPDYKNSPRSQLNLLKPCCPYINDETQILEFPKVIEEGR